MWHEDILGTIGGTPLVRVNRLAAHLPGTVLAKLEFFNPGGSVKDRIGVSMLEDAVERGALAPGGTIIEGTSGNTGVGLALVAIARGYRCIFTTTDKQSPEKIAILRALGAEVIVCPTAVAAEDPRSYYQVARRLAEETPNSVYLNQYDNPANTVAHVRTTGPELWEGTEERITHLFVGSGTGGTISGSAAYLKERNPDVRVIGVDPYGSVYWKYFHTREFDEDEIYPYVTEGVGEDILAGNMNFDIVDDYVRVTDKESMLMTRRLAHEEGMFLGGSCGMAMAGTLQWMEANRDGIGADDVLVVLMPDGGYRSLGKVYNDVWMQEHGFLEADEVLTAGALAARRSTERPLVSAPADMTLDDAIGVMRKHAISQVPVMEGDEVVGSLTERDILRSLMGDPDARARLVRDLMGPPFPVVAASSPVHGFARELRGEQPAVLVREEDGTLGILTRSDLIAGLGA
ncbi:pyridoxal-phosphate dependent enzyme [Candidatus Palauibacter sp.]|uniref:pyridoxal-phosphate dependent enzyme n=1 Tax=Candidatus Palauibacter sp. TaxID=3101350 RepID=UPI003AF2436B